MSTKLGDLRPIFPKPSQSVTPLSDSSDEGGALVRRWKSTDPYPQGRTFGELLDWHLWRGTRPEFSKSKKNPRWEFVDFAQAIHIGVPATEDPGTPDKKLRDWRKGRHLPNNDTIVQNIFEQLFGNDHNLADWKHDLHEALEREREARATPAPRRSVTYPAEIQRIPRPTAHFVGRDEDVEFLAAALTSDDRQSAVLVQGGPGIGKTELTKAIAHHDLVADRFGDRRWFVRLETATTADAVKDAIIRAIGCDPQYGFQAALNTLRDQHTLLVLDNLETPWELREQQEATEQVLAELGALPELNVLASFRGREVVGGLRWRIDHELDALTHPAATALFASIAGQWVRDDPALDNFLNALGGIPLAVDLVARRAHGHISLAPLWREWTKLGADLAVRLNSDAERSTSLPHSIELSLHSRRITEPALRLFRLLGALPGCLAAEDVEALLGPIAFEATERLYRAGLVQCLEWPDLLPPVRQYAFRHYKPDERDVAPCNDYFNTLMADDYFSFGLVCPDSYLRNFELTFKNRVEGGGIAEAMEALDGFELLSIWTNTDLSVVLEASDRCLEKDDLSSYAKCMTTVGWILYCRKEYEQSLSTLKTSLIAHRTTQNKKGIAWCLMNISKILYKTSDFGSVLIPCRECLKLYRALGNLRFEAECLILYGDALRSLGKQGAAIYYYSKAVTLADSLKYPQSILKMCAMRMEVADLGSSQIG